MLRMGSLAVFGLIIFASADATPDVQAPPGRVRILTRAEAEPAIGLTLTPPPDDYEPGITATEALERAWDEEGRPDASTATATLGLLTSEQFAGLADRPVWRVVYEGVCVKAHGPPDAPGNNDCYTSEYYVVIDATDGSFLFAYANELPGATRVADPTDPVIGSTGSGASGSTSP